MATDNKAGAAPSRNQAFNRVVRRQQPRNLFDLSHRRLMPVDFGQLIPSLVMEVIPGDTIELGNHVMAQLQSLFAPILDSAYLDVQYYFCPNRLTWDKVDSSGDNWETFRTRGVSGTNSAVVPRWDVTGTRHGVGSLWDMLGLPTFSGSATFHTTFPDAIVPVALPLRAYNLIYNEWYRDETLNSEVSLDQELILVGSWPKDYFTSALPFQQRGVAPALPISGFSSAVWPDSTFANGSGSPSPLPLDLTGAVNDHRFFVAGTNQRDNMANAFNANTVDFSDAATANINDLRLNAVLQQLLERNATGGVRYTEFLQHEFGVDPEDYRLQRPEFIGGYKQPVVFSEVIQTSANDTEPTPLGNKAGHGISVSQGYAGRYTCKEEGYIIGILRVMPVPSYQQGIDRFWSRVSPYDWPLPAFAGLGEQAVLNQELYLNADSLNVGIFGYQARYNEMRYMRSSVHGAFRDTLKYWHFGRIFSARPILNSTFVNLTSGEVGELNRVFQVPSQPGFLVNVGNIIRAVRPIPAIAVPGISRI